MDPSTYENDYDSRCPRSIIRFRGVFHHIRPCTTGHFGIRNYEYKMFEKKKEKKEVLHGFSCCAEAALS